MLRKTCEVCTDESCADCRKRARNRKLAANTRKRKLEAMKNETAIAPRKERIAIQMLRIDGGTQSRAEIDHESTIPDYQALIKDAWELAEHHAREERSPDVQFFFKSPFSEDPVAFYDGKDYWLADGFHRTIAFKNESISFVDVNVYDGTRRDAILYAAGANAKHGLRRTNKDKKHSVMQLLNDTEWRQWSNPEIARQCHVSDEFVRQLRASLPTVGSEGAQGSRTYITKHGTTATMKTGGIGKSKKEPKEDLQPVGEITGAGETVLYKDDPTLQDADVFDEEDESPVDSDDLTDEEWLQTLPLYSHLKNFPGFKVFCEDALAWRAFHNSGTQGKLKHQADTFLRNALKVTETRGDFLSLIRKTSRIASPQEWEICPVCAGSEQYWMNTTNKQHEAPATVAANNSNEYELRCITMNCKDCTGGYRIK